MPASNTAQPTQELRLNRETWFRGKLTGLEPARTYSFELIDPTTDRVADSGYVATRRHLPMSQRGHVVDGAFTCIGQDEEWTDVQPTIGRYAYLYVDFDGANLHLLNDWHLCREPIAAWDCNKFDLRTYPADDSGFDHALNWLIRVYPNGRVAVELDEEQAPSELVRGTHGHGTSPLVPDDPHSLYELAIDVAAAHRGQSEEPPEAGWRYRLDWLDPPCASPTPEKAEDGLIAEPVSLEGTLFPNGGMTVIAHWAPPHRPDDPGPRTTIWVRDDWAVLSCVWPGDGPRELVCRMQEMEWPVPTGRQDAHALGGLRADHAWPLEGHAATSLDTAPSMSPGPLQRSPDRGGGQADREMEA